MVQGLGGPSSFLQRCGSASLKGVARGRLRAGRGERSKMLFQSQTTPSQKELFYFEHPHPRCRDCRDTLVGHSKDTLGLGTPVWGWALQKHSGAGNARDTVGLGTPG